MAMDVGEVTSASVRRVQRGGAVALSMIAIAAWLGWATDVPQLAATRPMYIPMAPNTALCFFLLATALWLRSLPRGVTRHGRVDVPVACAATVALIGLARVGEFATDLDLSVDRWFFQVSGDSLGLAPVGKMALFTAIVLVVASLTVGVLVSGAHLPWVRDVGGTLGLLVLAAGAIFLLGYLFDAPLLYGGRAIPMALNTALAFVVLGMGIVAEAGSRAFPLRPLLGPSVHSRLLRAFLPFVVVLVCMVAWLIHLVTINVGDSAAAILSALSAVLAMIIAGVICARIARRVGGQLERAEEALLLSQEALEGRVAERTRELRQANALLDERNRQLQQSHQELQVAHQELKRAESQLVQSETLSAMGKMVAGVAHEINNPLAFVTNNVAVLQRDVGYLHRLLCLYQEAEGTLAEHQRELLSRIRDLGEQIDLTYVLDHLGGMMVQSRDGLKRIQQIVKGLRDFARIDESELKEVDLNAGIASTVEIMRPLSIQQRVALEMDLESLPALTCYAAKINQVVLNLVANAIDASPPGGLVTVRSRPTAQGIQIDVIDEGGGIDPAIRDRIFDPFFTTKPVGKGTGLGLSISYGIIHSHGGRIDVESSVGKGTRFSIHLPVEPKAAPTSRIDGHPQEATPVLPAATAGRDRDRDPAGFRDESDDVDESRKRASTGRGGAA
jgi:two-component system NtrC family sensor kinase